MSSPRIAESRDRLILQAAAELFAEKGFGSVGVNAIGERAGISGPGIYFYFKSKDEILAAILMEVVDGLLTSVGEPREDPHEDLEHLIRKYLEMMVEDRPIASVWVRESRSLAPQSRRTVDRRLARLHDRWFHTLERCYPDAPDAARTTATYALIGFVNSLVLWPGNALGAPDLVDQLVAMGRAMVAPLTSA